MRSFFSDTIAGLLATPDTQILGGLLDGSRFNVDLSQRDAWTAEIAILKASLTGLQGKVFLEYSIPRMGHRVDAVVVTGSAVLVIEFKVGESEFSRWAIDQVWDYALDLKYFQQASHDKLVAPILVATDSPEVTIPSVCIDSDNLIRPICASKTTLSSAIRAVISVAAGEQIDPDTWHSGRYCPTPTIVEAAKALYGGHAVADISRNDAGATNLRQTSSALASIIERSRQRSEKSICFVTGVPGAGKTLIGLDIATRFTDRDSQLHSVFLSGNGPLVNVLREALARDAVFRATIQNQRTTKSSELRSVKAFIQPVHHFRDAYLDEDSAPVDHVALFDEAQRAWNLPKTQDFMKRKRSRPNFEMSEPEFLISCLDRHSDWAVVVCLVGGGQEIHTGEAGIREWLEAIHRSFPDWRVLISPHLSDSEYEAKESLTSLIKQNRVEPCPDLHLGVSMRSFRAENVSLLVKQILDLEVEMAKSTLREIDANYEIVLTRSLNRAKQWLRQKARGSERYGIVVSSAAERLKPHAINVKAPMDPVHWFLDGKDDVRSSYYLEDVATEFAVQGLELDWVCVTWDADFRHSRRGWDHWSFSGNSWKRVLKDDRKWYQKNAYRVLLTRARQGMVIVIPEGSEDDPTRSPDYYDPTYNYLRDIGLTIL